MLALKLLLVPSFLLAVSLAGRRWGPRVAGWLAGMPVVAGPILFILAIEQGPDFAAAAALAALYAIFALVFYGLVYAHAARRLSWPPALLSGWLAWFAGAMLLSVLPTSTPLALIVALATLTCLPRCFPTIDGVVAGHHIGVMELLCRMAAGALLTLIVAALAKALGERWSGLLSVFPVMGTVLAVFCHRGQGPGNAAAMLRGMATGLYAFAVFCLVLVLGLQALGIATGFVLATAAAIAVQMQTRRLILGADAKPTPERSGNS